MDQLYMQTLIDRTIYVGIVLVAIVIGALLTSIFVYLFIIYSRLKKREQMSMEMVTLEVKVGKDNEVKIDAAEQMFASFSSLGRSGFFSFLDIGDVLAFEIVAKKADIRFYVSVPNKIVDLVEKTIYGFYPSADILHVDEPNIFSENGKVAHGAMITKEQTGYLPLKTYRDIPSDSLSSVTSALSKMDDNEGAIVQILIRPSDSKWKKLGKSYVSSSKRKEADPEKATFKTDPNVLEKIDEKCNKTGFDTIIKIVVSAKNSDLAKAHLRNIKNSFGQFESDQNAFKSARIVFKGGFMMNFIYKFFPIIEFPYSRVSSILSSDELASIFHFPNKTVETPYIQWLKAKTAPVSAEAPTSGGP